VTLTDTQLLQLAQHGAKARIEELRQEIASLQALISGNGTRSSINAARPTPPTVRRRRISAAGRARIAAAQKARWAKIKGTATSANETTPSGRAKGARKRRRGMSASQRAAVSRRMKAYWAKRRGARARK
jgi:hypothetical protein